MPGKYANRLAELNIIKLDLQSAVQSYANAIDRSVEAIDMAIAMVNIIESQSDVKIAAQQAETAIQMLNVALDESLYNDSFDQSWKGCILKANAKYRQVVMSKNNEIVGPLEGSIEDVKEMLRELNDALGHDDEFAFRRKKEVSYFENGENFLVDCKNAAKSLVSPVIGGDTRYIHDICEEIYYREWESKKDPVFEYRNKNENPLFCTSVFSSNYLYRYLRGQRDGDWGFFDFVYTDAKTKEVNPEILKIHIQCKRYDLTKATEKDYEDYKFYVADEYGWEPCVHRKDSEAYYYCDDGYAIGETCPDSALVREDTAMEPAYVVCEDEKLYFQLDSDYIDVISEYVTEVIREIDIDRCENFYGCSEGDEFCMGPGGQYYAQLQEEIESTGEDLEEYNSRIESALIQDYSSNLLKMLKEISANWIRSRQAISSKLTNLQNKINELSRLEQSQVDLFESFINQLNTADAASYSSLTEWTERYNQKEKRYQEQLQRARLAAWTAQRAIEFRFGIDLSQEHDMTIYGDVPSQWVNELLYEDYTSTCGVDDDTSNSDATDISGCYSETERIEDYIQKLEDFVESYGNSPGQEWWLHEEDDTAIISLKKYYNITGPIPVSKTVNHLYFSEEFDMTEEMRDDQYNTYINRIQQSRMPSTWSAIGYGTVHKTDSAIAEYLDTPPEVVDANNNSEKYVFGDRNEEYTAEVLYDTRSPEMIDYNTDKRTGVTQTIRLAKSWLESGDLEPLDFSVFLKIAPDDECDMAAGETYFPDLGRCGIACDPKKVTPEGTAEACQFGQICMPAGGILKPLAFAEQSVYMCDWCAADGACIEQDGSAVRIGMDVVDVETTVVASKNVSVGRKWQRQRVSTMADWIYDSPYKPNDGTASVYIHGTNTQNLVAKSELYQEEKGWKSGGNAGGILPLTVTAPNEAGQASVFEMSVTKETGGEITSDMVAVSTLGQTIDQNQYTGSMWVQVIDSSDDVVPVTLALESDSGVRFGLKEFKKRSDNWSRIDVNGMLRTPATDIRVVLSLSGDNLTEGETKTYSVAVWGVQIEWGNSATPYIPIGKNILIDSKIVDSTAWQLDGSSIPTTPMRLERNSDIRSPGGKKGDVVELFGNHSDNIPSFTDRIVQTIDVSSTADSYTYSVWLRTEKYSAHTAMIAIDGDAFVDPLQLEVSVEERWNRYAIVVSSNELDPNYIGQSSQISVSIAPTLEEGSRTVFVFGPQLEEGKYASGYEIKDENVPMGQRVWPLSVGVVGAMLSRSNTYYCNEVGQMVTLESGCEPNCAEGLFRCPSEVKDYVRNTYMTEHYPLGYHLEKVVDVEFPLIYELRAKMPDHIDAQNFRETLCSDEIINGERPPHHVCNFDINVDMIGNGYDDRSTPIAPDNFNYRIETIAVNLVGTNVINCEKATSRADCESNRWINYDLRHAGDEISVLNHRKENEKATFVIQPGYIHGGKAWASEQTIAYPISSEQSSALQQMKSNALFGRPLDGDFDLTLYTNKDEIEWKNVEDIQLILDYHYWSKSE